MLVVVVGVGAGGGGWDLRGKWVVIRAPTAQEARCQKRMTVKVKNFIDLF